MLSCRVRLNRLAGILTDDDEDNNIYIFLLTIKYKTGTRTAHTVAFIKRPETYFVLRIPMQFSTCSVYPQYGKRSTHRPVVYAIRNLSMARRDSGGVLPFYIIFIRCYDGSTNALRPIKKKKEKRNTRIIASQQTEGFLNV